MSQHRAERVALWRSAWFRVLLGLALLGCVGTTGTWAYWTDGASVTGTSLTAGTIDLRVDGQDAVTGYAALTLPAMVPGSTAAAVLSVGNRGTAPLRLTGASTATNPDGKNLAGALQVMVTADTGVTGSGAAATCAGTATPGSSSVLNAALLAPRTLAPSETARVCVQIALPAAAPATLQGGTTAVTLAFTGSSDLGA